MHRLIIILTLLFGLVCIEPSFGENLHPVTSVELSPVNMIDTRTVESPVQGAIELGYDDGRPGPRRDDPGPDTLYYDDATPRSLYPVQNLWSKVIFTTNADFEMWGVIFMPLNQYNSDAPCYVRVYSIDQDNFNLDELLWEGEIEQLNEWDGGDMDNNWHWIEIDEDDRFEIEGGTDFTVMYGPAPGGQYPPDGGQGGYWNVFDGATEVNRSYFAAAVNNEPQDDHGAWTRINGGDLLIRANGDYTGGFIDLAVEKVYNAEEYADRRWITLLEYEKNLFAEIINNGDEIEEYSVTFEVVNPDGDVVFEREIVMDEGIETDETQVVECDEIWEVPMEIGHYIVWVTVSADDDVNEENDRLGMEQIVFDQEESREMWIGYVDEQPDETTNWQPGNGWAVRFDHPGGNIPLWITDFRVHISGNNIDCPFSIHVIDLEDALDNDFEPGDPAWEGSARAEGQAFVEVELDEDDYVTMHDGEGLLITYYYVQGGAFRSDSSPPIAGTAREMPAAMMQTRDNEPNFTHARSGDYVIQIQMSGPDHGGILTGTVIRADNGSPIEDALVVTSQDHRDRTDENGCFEFPFGPHGDFTVTVSKQGYNTAFIDDLHLEDDEELDLEIALLHPEFEPSEDDFIQELEPDMEYSIGFNVINRGDGPLSYLVERRLVGEANIDPWEIRDLVTTEESLNDDMLNGVVFVNGHFYVSGGNSGENISKIYVLNREGELVRDFDQFHESRYGMRDLTWDGELIWGADDGVIYGFDTDGNLVYTIEGQAISYRSLTWDPEESVFWSADITSVIQATNLNGEVVAQIQRPGGINLYGFSYWGEDPDGYNLYIFSRGDETPVVVYKVNLDNGDHQLVAELADIEEGRAGGIFITNELDVFSWLFLGMVQTPDRLITWQLEGRRDWFQIEPDVGEIAADERQDFTLMLDATGLPPENVFRGEIAFIHNADDGETILPVSLEIVEGEVHTFRILNLETGWNTVSLNLQPDDGDNIIDLMAPLVEENLLIMMKNGAGQFYRPEFNYNDIPGWLVHEGYQILMRRAGRLRLDGWSVLREEPIELHEGWNLVSYYPRVDVEATLALSGIVGNLVIAKDGHGNFYIPDWNFCNMGMMREFEGYYMNVEEDVWLIYRIREEEDEQAALREAMPHYSSVYDSPGKLPVHPVTGDNMSLLVLAEPPLQSKGGTKGGVNIGIYADDALIGSGVLQNGMCGIAVWGDDPSTSVIDGAVDAQPLEIKVLSDGGMFSAGYTVLSGETEYRTDMITVIEFDGSVAVPDEFAITAAYPNPFNASVNVTYGLPEAAVVSLNVYDITGRLAAKLAGGNRPAGMHTITFDGSDLSSGIYLIQLEAAGYISQRKVVLVK
ncbi:carboxypeptidase regulatory-like domain-containing protein [bacterium]|nr:carboxypeptidase regulatory-like domain-containing protein [bacterium]